MTEIATVDQQARALRMGRRFVAQAATFANTFAPTDVTADERTLNAAVVAASSLLLALNADGAPWATMTKALGVSLGRALGSVSPHRRQEIAEVLLQHFLRGVQEAADELQPQATRQ